MYRVLIVDDEKIVRNGLKTHFPWNAHGLTVVGEAANGLEACAFLKEETVDIVITDVCMKKMDGIELARFLRENYPYIKIIFISGYDDLDYIRQALKLDVVDYILKVISFDELGMTLDRVRQNLDTDHKQIALMRSMEERLSQSVPLLQERLLVSLIRDDIIQTQELEERILFLDLSLRADRNYILLVMRLTDFYSHQMGKTERDRQLFELMLQTIISELLYDEPDYILFPSAVDELVIVLTKREDVDFNEHILDVAMRLSYGVEKRLNVCVRIGISQEFIGYPNMRKGYQSAVRALIEGYALRNNDVLVDQESCEPLYEQLEKQMLTAIEQQDNKALDRLEKQLRQIDDQYQLKHILFYLMIAMSRVEYNNRLSIGEVHHAELSRTCEAFFYAPTVDDMVRQVLQKYECILSEMAKKRENQVNFIVASIKRYIESEYTNNISLTEIAEHACLSPTYVSQLFKKETGSNITDYITDLRIECAKTLLCDPQIKLYNVCSRIGFISPAYFSRLFKKHTGMTPSEYRRIIIAPEVEKQR